MAEKPEIMNMSRAAIYTTADPFDQGVRALLHDQLCCQRNYSFHGSHENMRLGINVRRSCCHSQSWNGRYTTKQPSAAAPAWIGFSGHEVKYESALILISAARACCVYAVHETKALGGGECVSEQWCMCVYVCVSSQWLPWIGLPLSMSAGLCERTPLDYEDWGPMGQRIRSLLCYRKSAD